MKRAWVVGLACAAGAWPAWTGLAQEGAFEQPPPPPAREEGVLGGPEAPEPAQPGRKGDFARGEGPADGADLPGVMIEVRQLARARGEGGLTVEQGRRVREIVAAYQEARRAYLAEHGEEFDRLRAVLGELAPDRGELGRRRGGGERVGGDRQGLRRRAGIGAGDRGKDGAPAAPHREGGDAAGMGGEEGASGDGAARAEPTPEQAEALRAWRDLMAKGPSAKEAVSELLGVLTPAQREVVSQRLKAKAERLRRAQQERQGGRAEEGEAGEAGEPREEGAAGEASRAAP